MIIILINCKEIAQEIKDSIKNEISVKCRNKRKPILFVIQVGENEASNSYIKGKKKDCEEVGIVCKPVYLRNSITEHDLINIIQNVIALEECDGIIVQLPLPSHIDKNHIIDIIPKIDNIGDLVPSVSVFWYRQFTLSDFSYRLSGTAPDTVH